jgi:hypothetical protein
LLQATSFQGTTLFFLFQLPRLLSLQLFRCLVMLHGLLLEQPELVQLPFALGRSCRGWCGACLGSRSHKHAREAPRLHVSASVRGGQFDFSKIDRDNVPVGFRGLGWTLHAG